jgi:hypothetical protein
MLARATGSARRDGCRGAIKVGKVCAIKVGKAGVPERFLLLPANAGMKLDLLQRRIGLCGDAT